MAEVQRARDEERERWGERPEKVKLISTTINASILVQTGQQGPRREDDNISLLFVSRKPREKYA